MNNDNTSTNARLQKLSGSDFEVMDGDPEIQGWDVKDKEGRNIGEVDDLLFDTQSRKIRYLVLDLDFDELEADVEDRKVLIPVGAAILHKDDDEVLLTDVTDEQLMTLPEYDEDNFDLETESRIRGVFDGANANSLANDDDLNEYYEREYFDGRRLYKNRRL